MLERERLQLRRLEIPALLGVVEQDARLLALQQLMQLILRQER
jgi:hypothetical protein